MSLSTRRVATEKKFQLLRESCASAYNLISLWPFLPWLHSLVRVPLCACIRKRGNPDANEALGAANRRRRLCCRYQELFTRKLNEVHWKNSEKTGCQYSTLGVYAIPSDVRWTPHARRTGTVWSQLLVPLPATLTAAHLLKRHWLANHPLYRTTGAQK